MQKKTVYLSKLKCYKIINADMSIDVDMKILELWR